MPTGLVEINKVKELNSRDMLQLLPMVFIQSIITLSKFGIDANIRNMAELCATKGYTVFVPDLFWRDLPGCELNSNKDLILEQATKIIKNYNIDKGYEDIVSCLQWLRETPQCNGLVTTIGFGIGQT